MEMYNRQLAHSILQKLNEIFPSATSSDDLREFQVPGYKSETKEAWLDAIDALLKLGHVSGKDMREGPRLVDAAGLLITALGREELEKAKSDKMEPIGTYADSKVAFLSHAARDQKIAIYLKEVLEQEIPGCDVFVSSDTEDLRPGDDWVETVRKNLRDARILLLLATERGLTRPWVWYETGAAWSSRIRMIPCCMGNVRKNELPAPFSSHQAVNIDEASDLQNLLMEIGRVFGLNVQAAELQPILGRLRTLDQIARESDTSMPTSEEIQLRLDATNVSAKIAQGNRQWFVVVLTNESAEIVRVLHLRLLGPNRVLLAERYSLSSEPEEKRALPPNGTLSVEMRLQSDPAAQLASIVSQVGRFDAAPQVQADLTIQVGCEVLGKFKQYETNRRVQLDVVNHQITDYGF